MDIQKIEKNILKFWQENKIFEKSVENRKKARPRTRARFARTVRGKDFVFYEGPPTANGRPGIHHVLSRSFKDIMCRYKTMRGFRVLRKAGWDTHGLPVEIEVEKQLGLKNKKEIEKYGIARFNQKCRESVWKYKSDWEDLTRKIGFWLDMDHPYITYETSYMETLWWIIKQVWKRGLLYQDFKVVPYCARCGTGLSSHEVALGYKKIEEPSIFFKLKVKSQKLKVSDRTKHDILKPNTYLLVWTTTPWTLPGNVAVAVHPDIEYVEVKHNEENLILAKERLGALEQEYKILREFKGKDLLGLEYEPVFTFMKPNRKAYYVIGGDFVSTGEGTGLVHIAPAFGEEDLETGKKNDLPVLMTMKDDGTFVDEVKPWAGIFVKSADPLITKELASRGILWKEEPYAHDYPFCWRCDGPLLYMARKSWFIRMSKVKEDLILNNQEINWVPSHLKDGRFGVWLEELKDWAFSRERYWGTPLPIWRCVECGVEEAVGSLEDLRGKKYTANIFFVLRHGEADSNVKQYTNSFPEPKPSHLTERGRREIQRIAAKLKKTKIDVIITSPLTRTKETAQIVSRVLGGTPVIENHDLREIDLGILNGSAVSDYHNFFGGDREKFIKCPAGGENLEDVRTRMTRAIRAIDKNHANKTILLVSHEYPLWILRGTMQGMSREELIHRKTHLALRTGELAKLRYTHLPYGDDGELDLHRPYIDEVAFMCVKCGGRMLRVPDLVDVWFDSGAMPFAQGHWPFAQRKKEKGKRKKLTPPVLFPADFICEGIDQTRGWFYTLLAISTVLGFGLPYKNVISHGLVLDKKGEKMSKSRGNVVDPWRIVDRYGADAIRWYFYTVNQPADVKKFDENDVGERQRRFIGTLYNTYKFFETYKTSSKAIKLYSYKAENVLDRWITSRLHELITHITQRLDEYDIVPAAREIERFVDDLSNWYVRRSRRRFQRPKTPGEKREAETTLFEVLEELSKLVAPFAPFVSEEIFQKCKRQNAKGKNVKESVHLEDWPKANKRRIDPELERRMKQVRDITALGLRARARAGIKVRQPLNILEVRSMRYELGDFVDLIKEELNVKEVKFVKETNKNFAKEKEGEIEIGFDTTITPHLQEEGAMREIVRIIQDMRRDAGYEPAWLAEVFLSFTSAPLGGVLDRWRGFIEHETNATILGAKPSRTFDIEKETTVGGEALTIAIRRAS